MIWFVGAGCGARDLITVRGMRLLEKADVVIYAGSLVNPQLLEYTGRTCENFNSAEMTLEEVLEVMERSQIQGKEVVRLHTGDPSLYGAVREQMDRLKEKGIEYRCCPGVSACFGAAASLELEYTLPRISQTLIITRLEGRTGGVPDRERIEELAAHQASMAVYLSTGMLEELTTRLIRGGYPKDTPAALVYKATWQDEKSFRCPLWELPRIAGQNNITKTALVIVGKALGGRDYERSRLYAPDFETEFRGLCREEVEPEEPQTVREEPQTVREEPEE